MNTKTNLPFSWGEPKEESTSIAIYSSLADGKSHIVGAFVKIDSKEVFQNGGAFKIKLTQRTLDHSTFKIECRADEFDSNSDYPLSNTKCLAGKKIYIEFRQFNQTTFYFNGLITGVKRKKQGQDAFLIIQGSSPDILLEDGLMCKSFEDKTLDEIVQFLCQGYPLDLLTVKTKPKYKDRIPYATLYQKTRYEYIQMLSKRYGELLYWNGETLVFGGYGGKILELLDSEDMQEYEIHNKLIPQNFSYQAYHSQQGEVIQSDSSQVQKQNITNHFQQQLIEASKDIYPNQPESYYNHSLLETGSRELSELIKRQKQFRENVLFVEAKTYTPNLNIADIIKIQEYNSQNEVFKNKTIPMESYLIQEIKHYFESGEGYYNTLKAIPHEQFIPPYYDDKAYPIAEKQRAEITEVDDPLEIGRVRVRFDWMQPNEQTPWIRMTQPHSGADKGFNWKPEIGDEVMVDFESNSMDKPFVDGCLYNGKQKSNYDKKGNNLKVIKTRSGHTIILDDTEDKLSLTLTDKAGNLIYFDTMEKGITISAPEFIKIITKKLEIEVGEDIITNVGRNIKTTVQNEITQNSIGKTQITSSNNIEISADKTTDIYGKQKLITCTRGNAHMGALGQSHFHGTNTLLTATNQLDNKAPQMGELAEIGEFKYTKEKEITEVFVMDENFDKKIDTVPSKGNFHLLSIYQKL